MLIKVIAIGKLKAGAEAELVARYHKRAVLTGVSLGIKGVTLIEGVEGKQETVALRKASEASFIIPHLAGISIALDERGEAFSSQAFADKITTLKDSSTPQLNFIIGGADGLDDALRAKCQLLSFGRMTMPHQLARVLLLEQIYRSFTLMSNHPYHRV